jgi:hypothetical protein
MEQVMSIKSMFITMALKKMLISQKSKTQSLPEMMSALLNFDGKNSRALTGLARRTMVSSMTYIDDALIKADITPALMSSLNQLLIGYVLTALNIYNSVDRYKIVEQIIGRIANEDLMFEEVIDIIEDIKASFQATYVSNEDYDSAKIFTIEDAVKHLAVGRLIEFQFTVAESSSNTKTTDDGSGAPPEVETVISSKPGQVVVPIYVQLKPVVMPSEVAEQIIQLNFPASLMQRWKMVKAGEIRFFRDFIASVDEGIAQRKALKLDTSNVLNTFYFHKLKNKRRHVQSVAYGEKKNNLASSILIFDKETFDAACAKSSFKIDDAIARWRFFDESYAMMIVIVDQRYDLVDIYYNGISSKSELPFSSITQASKSKSGIDLHDLMKTIAKGAAPKF